MRLLYSWLDSLFVVPPLGKAPGIFEDVAWSNCISGPKYVFPRYYSAVIPAKAGIQPPAVDSRLRGNDLAQSGVLAE